MTFREKVVLVAGGTGGLGRAVSLAFLEQGARVIVTFRNEAELAQLPGVEGVRTNVTNAEEVAQLFEGIIAQHGRLDVMVNAVGGYAGGSPLWESPVENLNKMLELNLRAGFLLASGAAKAMVRQGRGAIVNIAAKAAFDHPAGLGAYSASKAAAVAMIDSLAADLLGTGVRVNSVLPSIIDTEANRKAMPNANYSRWPKPEAIAKVILFLCSDDGDLIHGASVPVYGH